MIYLNKTDKKMKSTDNNRLINGFIANKLI